MSAMRSAFWLWVMLVGCADTFAVSLGRVAPPTTETPEPTPTTEATVPDAGQPDSDGRQEMAESEGDGDPEGEPEPDEGQDTEGERGENAEENAMEGDAGQ